MKTTTASKRPSDKEAGRHSGTVQALLHHSCVLSHQESSPSSSLPFKRHISSLLALYLLCLSSRIARGKSSLQMMPAALKQAGSHQGQIAGFRMNSGPQVDILNAAFGIFTRHRHQFSNRQHHPSLGSWNVLKLFPRHDISLTRGKSHRKNPSLDLLALLDGIAHGVRQVPAGTERGQTSNDV